MLIFFYFHVYVISTSLQSLVFVLYIHTVIIHPHVPQSRLCHGMPCVKRRKIEMFLNVTACVKSYA